MKLTIERSALLRALSHVQSVVERRNTIPILSNLLIEATDDGLALTATDMDLALVERVAADVDRPGGVTAPALVLYDIVRKLPEGCQIDLHMGDDDGRLQLQAGRSRFRLQTLPQEDFPALSGGDMPHEFTMEAKELRRLIDRTRFAVSTEETRYYLNGIYLHATEGETKALRAVATDGHRLARVELPLPAGADAMPGVIVPRKTVGELRKLVDETDGEIAISLSETRMRFAFDRTVLTSKLVDGTFPEYERVIPSSNDKILTVERGSFAAAVDRVSTVTGEKLRAVKIRIDANQIEVSASSQENDTAVEELTAGYEREPIEIGFNSKYLLDITAQIEGESAEFALSDAASPTILRDPADTGALYVLMPLRV